MSTQQHSRIRSTSSSDSEESMAEEVQVHYSMPLAFNGAAYTEPHTGAWFFEPENKPAWSIYEQGLTRVIAVQGGHNNQGEHINQGEHNNLGNNNLR